MLTKVEQIEYLRKHYGHKFPMYAKFKRFDNRIYFVDDFEDNENIEFYWICSKPSACACGNAWYKGSNGISKLINIKEIKKD